MDLAELDERLQTFRPDDTGEDWGLRLVMSMVGNLSEGLMRADAVSDGMDEAIAKTGHTEEEIYQALEMAKADMIGALFIAVAELASEHGISIEDAVEQRLDRMQDMRDARNRMQRWEEAGLVDSQGNVDTTLDSDDDWAFM